MAKSFFEKDNFDHGLIEIFIDSSPVSAQSKNDVKKTFQSEVHKITSKCRYIVTSSCWIAIDYYCQHIKRMKNPGAYDIDNIVKPILDSLVGLEGVLIDDAVVDRVTVNWLDTHGDDYLEVEIRYPSMLYACKTDLVLIKSGGGWCFPVAREILKYEGFRDIIVLCFSLWDSVKVESDYFDIMKCLPSQNFIYFNKVKDKGYEIISLDNYLKYFNNEEGG
ncbi:RusA family crossover junction endodeoxyribonuclease [Hahella sp. HN01]|uniref:RusA family crossover junction endodeoxyribonuclease n=1 Tax=Hahella sp. HN01 TaxID=2847262 RepID=UPI001C1E94FD|nr:RusA family crossover junction endodeoxyribonuclease [Hahella sp. HN01]MBU6951320.1 RusA family crossover junction endodeoxyribonuclease [Hahella sp. HN01]